MEEDRKEKEELSDRVEENVSVDNQAEQTQTEVETESQETSPTPNLEESELELAQKEISSLKESWSRERAEFINFRKRSAQDRTRHIEDTLSSFLQEMLPIFDNLDQVLAMEIKSKEVKQYVEGLSLIRDNLVHVLNNRNIKIIHPFNEEFNPQIMEAIASEDKEGLKKDTVIEVFQMGYFMANSEDGTVKHLIRPARVRVGKAMMAQSLDAEG